MTRAEKVARFRAMHAERRAFVMPNPWDEGSARMAAHLGFEAVATTSAGFAFTLGRLDYQVSRTEALDHAARIVAAVPDLPVSGDLENGWADEPEGVARLVREAAEAGLAGLSIEDVHDGGHPYGFDGAVARIEAAVEAAREADIVLCARADGWMTKAYDLDEAERRIAAFASAGADCLYCPLLRDMDAVRRFAVHGPLNVLMGVGRPQASQAELAGAGVARISTGSAVARAAYGGAWQAMEAMAGGDFAPLEARSKAAAFDEALG